MIPLREAIQRVQSLYSRGVQSDDSRLTSRHIYSALISGRSILLSQKSTKKQKISQWSYQVLPCVELMRAAIHECPCIPSGNCMILRTKYKLPAPITNLDSHLIQSVTSLDGNITFDEDTFETTKYSKGNKFTGDKPSYYFRNSYLYITVTKQLKGLTLTGLFDDIIEAEMFPTLCPCEGCDCRDILDMRFPIEGSLIKPLIQIANDELITIMKQISDDRSNDASDNATIGGAMVHQPQQQQE